ncbi:Phosphatidylglycerophosphatase A [Candidatus Trichorickettsia mobilis]|uniref:Phosphatidylglycerophosphatase A n=1 Tax=Candidatus Trichorickettsia mobilis TaxID=1346319 RepID=A0ABZ0UTY5_9RICK|nr:phosphatidylglycerophosphatase A [Candidatus Trichorickettsia mobilis]WPY00552.1 Phosphatidylglycerophosphatase A [Candidatus Trichorickettsia mobilis]
MLKKEKIVEFVVTFCFIGKAKYCPGTLGSLAAFPLAYIIAHFTIINQIVFSFSKLNLAFVERELLSLFIILLLVCVLLFIIGLYFTTKYLYLVDKKDPQEVVIDEVVGQMLMITCCSFSVAFVQYSGLIRYLSAGAIDFIFLFVLPFSLFRFFDIVKPWPVDWLDKNINGAIGVMIDDVAAAILAIVMHYALTFTIIDWFR